MKKLFTVIMPVLLLAGHAYGQQEAGFHTIQNAQGTLTITRYTGTAKEVAIPETIEGIMVTKIGHSAFEYKRLTNITIPDSVASIEDFAFYRNSLANVAIGNNVISIGEGAFMDNQLASVIIPNSVASIGEGAFKGNLMKSITIGADKDYHVLAFPHNFRNFYESQGRKAGTYTWSGRLWSVK
jgi:hypothetical protein